MRSPKPAEQVPKEYLDQVRSYYAAQCEAYLEYLGTTWQGGLVRSLSGEVSARDSNLWLAERAGVQPGGRILDAGCGVCGPSMDIAEGFDGVRIDAITLEPTQIAVARRLIAARSLGERITVHLGDFHNLSFPAATFDAALFLESCGYSYDLRRLFSEVLRVLRPGGTLYIKDVCVEEGVLTGDQKRELREFQRLYAHRTTRVSKLVAEIRATGFERITAGTLNDQVSSDHFLRAMYGPSGSMNEESLTRFGRAHFGHFPTLRTVYGEIKAHAPAA